MKFDRRRFCFWIALFACIGLALCQADAKGVSAPRRSVVAVSLSKYGGKSNASVKCVVDAGVEVGVSAVAFTRDGKKLVVGGYKELVVWDLSGAKISRRLGVGKIEGAVHAITFLKDGKSVVVGEGVPGVSGAVRIFDIETGEQKAHLKDCKDVVYSLAISKDGKFLAAGSADNRAYVWTLADNRIAKVIKEHSGRVMGVAFSSDSKFLATGGSDNTTRIWKVEGWESVHRLNQVDGVRGVAFRADGKYVASAVGGSNGRIVRLHRMDNGKKHLAIYPTPGMGMDFVWQKSPNRIYAACSDNTVKLFDASSTRVLRTFKGHEDWVYSIALSPDEKRIASGSADGTVKLWNISDGKLLWTMNHLGAGGDDWVISSPAGYIVSSDAKMLKWESVKVASSAEELAKRFVNKEKVLEVVWGKKVAAKPAAKPREKTESIVTKGSVWKYLDDGSDQGKGWYGRDYKDDSWKSGAGELGYGDKVEKTVVGYGPDGTKKYVTTYFRRWFEVKNRGRYSKLYLDLVRDDGAVVYLNGKEILRSNMGKGNVTYKTVSSAVAGGADESKFFEFTIDAGKLVDGKNLLAVEIHQTSVTSSDLSFDLKLSGVVKKSPPAKVKAKPAPAKPREKTEAIVAKGSVWKYLDDGSDQGKGWYGRDFKDDSWKSGAGELGYGDKVEKTVVGYGPDGTKKFMTTYFRRRFEVKNRGRFSKLYLDLVRDDGAIVYLNGKEVVRSNMGKGDVTYKTAATETVGESNESKYYEFIIDAGKLVEGKNLLAVEIHQKSGSSSDMSFDLKLSGVAKKKEDK